MRAPRLRHVVVDGRGLRRARRAQRTPELRAEPTHRDGPAFWLYSSGSTGRPKGVRSPAARHGRLRGAVREGRPRHHGARSHVQRRQAVLRVRPRQRAVVSICGRRDDRADAGSADGPERVRDDRTASPDAVLLGADGLRDDARTRARGRVRPGRRFRSVVDPSRGLGGRSVAAGALRALQAALRRRRLDGIGSTEALHMFISNRPGAIRPGSSGQVVDGYDARLLDDDGRAVPRRRDRKSVDSRRFGVRRLLEPARENEGHDRRSLDPHRRQVLAGTRTGISGTRADRTTC